MAALFALGPVGGRLQDAFQDALCTWPEGSPQQRVAGQDALVRQILQHLPRPPDSVEYTLPGWEPVRGPGPLCWC